MKERHFQKEPRSKIFVLEERQFHEKAVAMEKPFGESGVIGVEIRVRVFGKS